MLQRWPGLACLLGVDVAQQSGPAEDAHRRTQLLVGSSGDRAAQGVGPGRGDERVRDDVKNPQREARGHHRPADADRRGPVYCGLTDHVDVHWPRRRNRRSCREPGTAGGRAGVQARGYLSTAGRSAFAEWFRRLTTEQQDMLLTDPEIGLAWRSENVPTAPEWQSAENDHVAAATANAAFVDDLDDRASAVFELGGFSLVIGDRHDAQHLTYVQDASDHVTGRVTVRKAGIGRGAGSLTFTGVPPASGASCSRRSRGSPASRRASSSNAGQGNDRPAGTLNPEGPAQNDLVRRTDRVSRRCVTCSRRSGRLVQGLTPSRGNGDSTVAGEDSPGGCCGVGDSVPELPAKLLREPY